MKFAQKKQALGLDIGHHSIKASLLESTPSGWHVVRNASMLVPDDMIKEGVAVDPDSLGQDLKSFLRTHQMLVPNAIIAVGGGSAVVRSVRVPKMTELALRKSLKIEASRFIPNSIEESYVDFEVVGMVDEHNMEVLIAAAPRDVTDSRIAVCEKAGLDVIAIEVGAFATFRALLEADHDCDYADKTVAIIDIGSHFTHFSVISKGKFSMTRAIQAGGHQLTEQLQSYFKLSFLDAESGKTQLDLSQLTHESKPTENPPLRVLQPLVDDLIREVRRSINYWQSQVSEVKGNKQLDQIYLCGGGAQFQGLDRYFESKLSLPTCLKGAFDNPRILPSTPSNESHGSEWPLSFGLAMAGHKQGKSIAKFGQASKQATLNSTGEGKKKLRRSKKEKNAASVPAPDSYDIQGALSEMEGTPAPSAPEVVVSVPKPKLSLREKLKKAFSGEAFNEDEENADSALPAILVAPVEKAPKKRRNSKLFGSGKAEEGENSSDVNEQEVA